MNLFQVFKTIESEYVFMSYNTAFIRAKKEDFKVDGDLIKFDFSSSDGVMVHFMLDKDTVFNKVTQPITYYCAERNYEGDPSIFISLFERNLI